MYSLSSYEQRLPTSAEELYNPPHEAARRGEVLEHEEACVLHARWLASCTRIYTLLTSEYTMFHPEVEGQHGVLPKLANMDIRASSS